MAVDVGKPIIAPLEAVGEPFVVEAEAVQNRGLEVVDVHLVAGHVEAEFIGLAVGDTSPDTPPPRATS